MKIIYNEKAVINMKYWDLIENVATLKRQVLNNNHRLVKHSFNNISISGIRFLIANDLNITSAEKQELLYEI